VPSNYTKRRSTKALRKVLDVLFVVMEELVHMFEGVVKMTRNEKKLIIKMHVQNIPMGTSNPKTMKSSNHEDAPI
jgi:hypothetical protein